MCAIFVPTTPILDVNKIKGKPVESPEFQEFMIRLTQYLNLLALASNSKSSGQIGTSETITGRKFFLDSDTSNPIGSLHKVVSIGPLPNGTVTPTKDIPHGINVTSNTIFTRIYGVSNNSAGGYIPLPYASPTSTDNIELSLDATDITIEVDPTIDWSSFTTTYVILEWINPQS